MADRNGVMQDGAWFDAEYFGHQKNSGEPKSNYARIDGGYKPGMAAPEQFAAWVQKCIHEVYTRPPKMPRVLEIGCATGAALAAMDVYNMETWGIDASEYIVGMADDYMRERIFVADMRELPAEVTAMTFTAIVSKDVLDHATEDVIDDILLSFAEISKHQFHVVNTGEFEHQAADGDQSHNLIRPLVWWQNKAEELGISAIFKAT